MNNEIALSFQDTEGAQETWEFICHIQGKDSTAFDNDKDEDNEQVLSPPTFESLPIIAEELTGGVNSLIHSKTNTSILNFLILNSLYQK